MNWGASPWNSSIHLGAIWYWVMLDSATLRVLSRWASRRREEVMTASKHHQDSSMPKTTILVASNPSMEIHSRSLKSTLKNPARWKTLEMNSTRASQLKIAKRPGKMPRERSKEENSMPDHLQELWKHSEPKPPTLSIPYRLALATDKASMRESGLRRNIPRTT